MNPVFTCTICQSKFTGVGSDEVVYTIGENLNKRHINRMKVKRETNEISDRIFDQNTRERKEGKEPINNKTTDVQKTNVYILNNNNYLSLFNIINTLNRKIKILPLILNNFVTYSFLI